MAVCNTFEQLKKALNYAATNSPFYRQLFADHQISVDDIQSMEDFQRLPFSDKYDLRRAYPLGLQAVPDEEVVRVHSSSGTTGKAIIIPYTAKDVDDWATMFARCYATAGITR